MLPRKKRPNGILKQLLNGACQLFSKNRKAPFEINPAFLDRFSSINKLMACNLSIEAPTA